MPWYAASAVMYFKWKDGPQPYVNVWENTMLIEAPDDEIAWRKAEELARQHEGDSDSSLTDDGHPATQMFAGIRWLQTVLDASGSGLERPSDGDEICYTELRLADLAAVEALAAGKQVQASFLEVRYPEGD